MVKQLLPAIAITVLLSSCASFKPLNFMSNKQVASSSPATNTETKFIDNITVNPPANSSNTLIKQETTVATRGISLDETVNNNPAYTETEKASAVQLKYSILLNTEVEELQNQPLLEGIDQWYGTRYRLGGTTKKGVDCSAFVGAIYASVFGIALPRTAREQYKYCRRVQRTELQEGDLVFFNTHGGVSHVGIYLQNNKFVHASVSNGVTISDLYDPYYLQRYVGAGRPDKSAVAKSFN
jgi:cell wall-associated NlpC family hydrolase